MLHFCAARANQVREAHMRAEIQSIDGNTEILVNGERVSRMLGRLSLPGEWAPEKLAQYKDAGIRIFLTNTDDECSLGWNGVDEYDYRPYEWHIERLVREKPDILLVLYVGCQGSAPYLWNVAHEDELPLLSNGDRLRIPSFASESWLHASCDALARFVRHFENSPFAQNIIGYNPVQYSNEWHTPSSRNHPPLDDYSSPMVDFFRSFLRSRYRDDVKALQHAWAEPEITFENASIPDAERRLRTGMSPLPFGEVDRAVWDFDDCLDQAKTRFIIEQCRAIKEAARESVLTMISRKASQEMLTSPWVDCFQGPYHYVDRKIVHVSGYPKGTYTAYAKLHMDQIDTGTHVMPKTGGDQLGMGPSWPGPFRLSSSEEDSLELLERDVAYSVALNGYTYWNEGGPGRMFPVVTHGTTTWGRLWFDTPAIRELIGRLKRLVDENAERVPASTARVAVVSTDPTENLPLEAGSPLPRTFSRMSSTMSHIARAGFTYDTYSVKNFGGIDRRYDLYIFTFAPHVTSDLRETILAKLEQDSASAVWYYCAGYVSEDGPALASMSELTGVTMGLDQTRGPVQVELVSEHPLLAGCDSIDSYGSRTASVRYHSYEPLDPAGYTPETQEVDLPAQFFADDPEADVLGRIEGTERAGLVIKRQANRFNLWTAAPELPWRVLANVAREAGTHVYSTDGDQLVANDRFVAMYCLSSGTKRIMLPRAARVNDALTGDPVTSEPVETVEFSARAGETRSFVLE
jgi:hypothetical protein